MLGLKLCWLLMTVGMTGLFLYTGSGFALSLAVCLVALVLCAVGSTPVVGFIQRKLGRLGQSELVGHLICFLLLVLSAAYIVSSSYNPFIYFAF